MTAKQHRSLDSYATATSLPTLDEHRPDTSRRPPTSTRLVWTEQRRSSGANTHEKTPCEGRPAVAALLDIRISSPQARRKRRGGGVSIACRSPGAAAATIRPRHRAISLDAVQAPAGLRRMQPGARTPARPIFRPRPLSPMRLFLHPHAPRGRGRTDTPPRLSFGNSRSARIAWKLAAPKRKIFFNQCSLGDWHRNFIREWNGGTG